jgi:hypothetical protein
MAPIIAVLRSRTVKEPFASRLLFPVTERDFTYARYDAWLAARSSVRTVRLDELADSRGPVLALRHDVDDRLESALEFGRLEHARGVQATYFVLSTAPYYTHGDAALVRALRTLQDDQGHEIGWHNDLLTLEKVHGVDAGEHLARELEWLRSEGIRIHGSASHGSPWCHRLGYHNNYVFSGWDEPVPGFSNRETRQKLDPSAYGLDYEAYHLEYDAYFSDSTFVAGRRVHPDSVIEGVRTVVLTHPCHWDRSAAAKTARLARKVGRRLVRRSRLA